MSPDVANEGTVTVGTAIVIGAGIGGLAAAAGLARAGWRVTVFEQAPAFAPAGAGISLAPNAVRALDRLGLGRALRQRGVATGAAGIRTASGRWLLRTTVDQLTHRYGEPAFLLHRADLHGMLHAAAGPADLRTGHRVTGVTSRPDGAEVQFQTSDRSGTERADLVVAADGIHSAVRHQMFPDHPGAVYAGYVTWRGVVPAASAPTNLSGITETWGRGRRFGIAPLADGRVYWFATTVAVEGTRVDDDLSAVAGRFAGWHEPIPGLLAATPRTALLGHDIYHVATPLPAYATGRVVLLGDAAHAVTPDLGQGAALALEDAVVLSAVTSAHGDLGAALAEYDRLRRPRTQRLVRASARVARLANARHRSTAWLRDAAARALPTSAYLSASADAFAWQPPAYPRPAPQLR
jgi:2-polyprenyl-6-methoxyphenol hydroxylase-like FAD-dependent oxidoreductase